MSVFKRSKAAGSRVFRFTDKAKNLAAIFFLAGFLFLGGCATLYNPATGRNEFILIDSETETALGKSVVKEVTRQHPLAQEANLQERARRAGRKLAQASDRQDIEYNFSVLNDKELNAMALPGGFIFVNKGLMNVLDDDELAYVLGHEVGHVAARHIAKKLQSGMAYQLLMQIAFAGAGSDAAAIAGGIDTVYNLIDLGYSRQDEYEADRLGVKYAFRAGFKPGAALSSLEKIKQEEGPNWKVLGYFRSHPYAEERIAALKKIIPQLTAPGKNSPEK